MKNILIIGCGLLGSSLLRQIKRKKITKKIYIYEKSKVNISKIKKLKLPGIIIDKLQDGVTNSDLIMKNGFLLGAHHGMTTEDGYNIKNKLRLTIGSNKENTKFIKAIKSIFN